MYKKIIMIVFGMIMSSCLVASNEQDSLENIKSATILTFGNIETIHVNYHNDPYFSYTFCHNKMNNSYIESQCNYACRQRLVPLWDDGDSHSVSFPISAERFHAIKNIVVNNF